MPSRPHEDMRPFIEGARQLGISLSGDQIELFRRYGQLLVEWNQRMNLTAIEEWEQILRKHFLDSLALLTVWKGEREARAIDIGAGAGFPGLPLKIARPELQMTLVEATEKKVSFLRHVVQQLGLNRTTILQERAEVLGRRAPYREEYHLVVARAVAPLPELCEYTLPFATVGGLVAAYKGPAAFEEIGQAEYALSLLGGELERVVRVEIPGVAEERHLVLIRKTAPTPAEYPRRPGVPHKHPLQAPAG